MAKYVFATTEKSASLYNAALYSAPKYQKVFDVAEHSKTLTFYTYEILWHCGKVLDWLEI